MFSDCSRAEHIIAAAAESLIRFINVGVSFLVSCACFCGVLADITVVASQLLEEPLLAEATEGGERGVFDQSGNLCLSKFSRFNALQFGCLTNLGN